MDTEIICSRNTVEKIYSTRKVYGTPAVSKGCVYVNKMQKCLELMHIKLKEVINQTHEATSIKMIKAILSGNRDKAYLLSLSNKRIANKKGKQVLKSFECNYNECYLFLLEQNLHLREKPQEQIIVIDKRIEKQVAV